MELHHLGLAGAERPPREFQQQILGQVFEPKPVLIAGRDTLEDLRMEGVLQLQQIAIIRRQFLPV